MLSIARRAARGDAHISNECGEIVDDTHSARILGRIEQTLHDRLGALARRGDCPLARTPD
jgi:hypothetical protein